MREQASKHLATPALYTYKGLLVFQLRSRNQSQVTLLTHAYSEQQAERARHGDARQASRGGSSVEAFSRLHRSQIATTRSSVLQETLPTKYFYLQGLFDM